MLAVTAGGSFSAWNLEEAWAHWLVLEVLRSPPIWAAPTLIPLHSCAHATVIMKRTDTSHATTPDYTRSHGLSSVHLEVVPACSTSEIRLGVAGSCAITRPGAAVAGLFIRRISLV